MKPPMKNKTAPTKTRHSPKKAPTPHPGMGHMGAEDVKYRARSDFEHLQRAQEIQADPQRMTHVRNHANEVRNHATKILRRKAP